MKRTQWFVLGIGLVLTGFFIGFLLDTDDCSKIQNEYIEQISEAIDLELGMEFIQTAMSSSDAWTISCLNTTLYFSLTSAVISALGLMFIIIGFLEPKERK